MTMGNGESRRPTWKLHELLRVAGVRSLTGHDAADVRVTDVTDNSRTVRPGAMFVAIRGEQCDGHAFVPGAVAAGAAVMVTERPISIPDGCVGLVVNDTRLALGRLSAAFWRLRGPDRRDLKLIGVTGTNGKTTTAWLLRSIFRASGESVALLGTVEYDLIAERIQAPQTTPGPTVLAEHLARAHEAGGRFAVFEVSSHALTQMRCDGLSFAAGVFTNLSGDHLDYHQSMEAYAAAKRRLFDLLAADGVALVNVDDAVGRSYLADLSGAVVGFGLKAPDADVSGTIECMNANMTRFRMRGRGFDDSGGISVRWPLVGEHNVYNALAAAATAEALGIPVSAIVEGLQSVSGVPGRLQRVEPPGCDFSVFVDYAHTDAALVNVLSTLRGLARGRLLCVFGCGGERDRTKRPRMGRAVAEHADLAFVTSDNPRREDPQAIMDEILPGFQGFPPSRVAADADRRAAIGAAIEAARSGDIVLIAGKGHEACQEINGVKHPFDDVTVAREWLSMRRTMREAS